MKIQAVYKGGNLVTRTVGFYGRITGENGWRLLKTERVPVGGDAHPPLVPVYAGYTFREWGNSYTGIQTNINIYWLFLLNMRKGCVVLLAEPNLKVILKGAIGTIITVVYAEKPIAGLSVNKKLKGIYFMTKTLILEDNIEGEKYRQLIDMCFDLSTHFSFTKRNFHTKNSIYLKFLKDLEPSYIETVSTWHWFSYHLYSSKPLEVCLYHADIEMKFVIKKYIDNLFQLEKSMNGKSRNVKNLPEDLCFFKDDQLLLGTVSHEEICLVYPPTEDITNQFKKMGNWEEINYIPQEHICIKAY